MEVGPACGGFLAGCFLEGGVWECINNRWSCASFPQQRSLHATQISFPTTADCAQFDLLCHQPEPIPRSLSCQDGPVCTGVPLQAICLVRTDHPHSMQDLKQSLTLLHPTPHAGLQKGTTPPSKKSEHAGRFSPKKCLHFSICACHPCAGAMLIFSVSFQF